MTANELIIAKNRKAKMKLISDATRGLKLEQKEIDFLAYVVEAEDTDTISRICSIIRKAKEYRQ